MFNILPGQGLGFTGSKQIALGLVDYQPEVIDTPVDLHHGSSSGLAKHKGPYLAQALREDEEIILLIQSLF